MVEGRQSHRRREHRARALGRAAHRDRRLVPGRRDARLLAPDDPLARPLAGAHRRRRPGPHRPRDDAKGVTEDTDAELDKLELADWRRRVSDLYAEVRATAATNPRAAWERSPALRACLYPNPSHSPLPP